MASHAWRFSFGAAIVAAFFLIVPTGVRAVSDPTFSVTIIPGPQCYDGIDNDSDGFTDYPDDDDCESPNDTTEGIPVSEAGGHGHGLSIEPTTSITFSGFAYPNSTVELLCDGMLAARTTASADASFSLTFSGMSGGDYLFSLSAESIRGRTSIRTNVPLSIFKGSLTSVGSIVIPPTLFADRTQVARDDEILFEGDAVPRAEILGTLAPNAGVIRTRAQTDGTFAFTLDTEALAPEAYALTVKEELPNGMQSRESRSVEFFVGDKNEQPVEEPAACQTADLNCDGRIDIVDFSIAAFWNERPLGDEAFRVGRGDLNDDGRVDLIDFSIMAYYWTG